MRDDVALRAEVWRLADPALRRVREVHGSIPAVGGAAWWDAPDWVRRGSLLVLAERWLLREDEIEQIVTERLRAMSADLAQYDWTAAARRPSHAELQRRRRVVA